MTTLVATETLALKEPAHTQAMELLVEERVTVALAAHFPRGDKRKELKVHMGEDRIGRARTKSVPKTGTLVVGIDEGHHILEKYGEHSSFMATDPEGNGLKPEQRFWVYEVPLEQNADITLRTAFDGQLLGVNGVPTLRSASDTDEYVVGSPERGEDVGEEVDISDDEDAPAEEEPAEEQPASDEPAEADEAAEEGDADDAEPAEAVDAQAAQSTDAPAARRRRQ
jgi:hypothetical protein